MIQTEVYTLQDNTTIDVLIMTARELVVKAKYLCSKQVGTNWYWKQLPKQHVIIVLTRTILYPRLEVNSVTYFHVITKNLCNRSQAKQPYQYILYV